MPVFNCPLDGCTFATEDIDPAVAASMLMIHNNVHINESAQRCKQKPPKIDRPQIGRDSSEETWNTFIARWQMFKEGTQLSQSDTVRQLFQCCDDELGEAIIKGHSAAINSSETELMRIIKQLAVTPVSVVVRRSEFLSTKQDLGENTRAFSARLKGKAATCSYSCTCTREGCDQLVDFTDIIVKDVLITGLVDEDIRKDVLGWEELDNKNIDETVRFIEAKEMARDALTKAPVSNASISTYKKLEKLGKKSADKICCSSCHVDTNKYVWNRRQNKYIECTMCLKCWKASKKSSSSKGPPSHKGNADEASALLIGAVSSTQKGVNYNTATKEVKLDHYIFDSVNGWEKSESLKHPTLSLNITTDEEAYSEINVKCPKYRSDVVVVVTDTGAQSCLWSLKDFLRCGYKRSDLLPVKRTMLAANTEQIDITGALFVKLSGKDASGNVHTAPVMVYVSPSTSKFYLSRNALIKLSIIDKDFPSIGAAAHVVSAIDTREPMKKSCDCLPRVLPPGRPSKLPFKCVPENNEKMKEWLLQRYSSSTFNKCTHQLLPAMTGPPLKIHVDPDAIPVAANTPTPVPKHWEGGAKEGLDTDTRLGVISPVPVGYPQSWCHRMILIEKDDGTLRRAVDFTPLNRCCLRETHHVKPPFLQARQIPPDTWKTVTDAWNGFHSVPLRPEDRHLTTFITPWGRYWYNVAPQGYLASTDAYSRRGDEILVDVPRKTKNVDDTALWDEQLSDHWWRIIDYLELMGKNGVILNPKKFQFAQKEINFSGFKITEKEIKPLDKFMKAIKDFPSPKCLTDVRSWFGLVHQVSHYGTLTDLMAPFKPLLSPKTKFYWNADLEAAFNRSKNLIIEEIRHGIEIFDLNKPTCLQPDWSKTGIGFFLNQKHCMCDSTTPDCCLDGWRIVLVGSRFLKPAESRYAPVEGEALAIAWALEQSRYFTQGCKQLLVLTDHKPLVKLFSDRALDEIPNPRLFSLKQRTLPWRFSIQHRPGKDHVAPDAMSRHPVDAHEDDLDNCLEINASEILAGIRLVENDDDLLSVADIQIGEKLHAITWNRVKVETQSDPTLTKLKCFIESAFPEIKQDLPSELEPYWVIRDQLCVYDGVIVRHNDEFVPGPHYECSRRNDGDWRIIIPKSLRNEVLQVLHSAHQGIASMNERAKTVVYWPGITNDIAHTRNSCRSCNLIAPSNPRLPPVEPMIPKFPFEAIACDFFYFKGWYYFVAGDRLSGWTEQQRVKVGTSESGANGLCNALRKLFVTFGVPIELSSDGGPEFSSKLTESFLKRWGVKHRLSSAYYPSSNGRAELAVKSTKRLLMENVGPNGALNNDKMVRALLTQRNTPDPGCKLSPAQILLGRNLRDSLPYIRKDIMAFNNSQISGMWRKSWNDKEETLRARYVKTLENLSEHTKLLPPLQCGEHVLVQNQTGRFPKKWGKSGVIVELKDHHQYVVKIDGSGRLTLRNRQFLRRYQPPGQSGCSLPPVYSPATVHDLLPSGQNSELEKCHIDLPTTLPPSQNSRSSVLEPALTSDSSVPLPFTEPALDQASPVASVKKPRAKQLLTRLADFNNPGLTESGPEGSPGTVSDIVQPRRSTRASAPRQAYDASSGTYQKL